MLGRHGLLIFGALISQMAPLDTATAVPEPGLQPSRKLGPMGAPASETERNLLRLEHRSGQFRVTENETLVDMTARIQRMGQTIAELHQLIAAIPPSQPCPAVAETICPSIVAPPATPPDKLPWWSIAAGAGVLALLAFWLGRRTLSQPIDEMAVPTKPLSEQHTIPVEAIAIPTNNTVRKEPPPLAATPDDWETQIGPSATEQPAIDDSVADADLSLELADVMVSMGLAGGAAQTLEGHIRQHPRQALFHWLKLLDVYRRFGQREEFNKAILEMQQHFNITPPSWQSTTRAPIDLLSLEDYPHIISRLQELWPRRSCAQYLSRLIEDNRGGTRSGFPQPVVEEILFLLDLLRA